MYKEIAEKNGDGRIRGERKGTYGAMEDVDSMGESGRG